MIDLNFKNCFFVAEIGVNHNGNIELAKTMIKAAKESGADAVKFQTFIAEKLVNKSAKKVKYQIQNTEKQESHYQMIKRLELTKKDHYKLKLYCEKLDILFLSTPYDVESAKFLNEELNIPIFKTASADIVDIPLQTFIASTLKPCLISIGMANISEIEKIFKIYQKFQNNNIAFLHCVSNYPASDKSLNLKVIKSISNYFNVPVGFSDHSLGAEAAITSVALGSRIIEKHFTTDKSLPGPDQKASSTPNEFNNLVLKVKRVEKMLGNSFKEIQEEEKEMHKISRKSFHLTRNISKNEIIKNDDLILQRPGDGLSYSFFNYLIGKKASKDLLKGDQINIGDVF